MSLNSENSSPCANACGLGTKLMFLAIGGGVGAAIALLFAPKPGKELRQDIADAATKGYDKTVDAAERVKERTSEYYEAAKEKGEEIVDAIGDAASAVRHELAEEAEKIGNVASDAAHRVADTVRTRQIF